MKRISFILFLNLAWHLTNAQTQITGRITDLNGDPLYGASIYLPEQSIGTISNEDGEFQIVKLPSGEIRIQFSYIGYNTVLKSILLRKGTNEINISLTKAIIETQEIVVSGSFVSSQHENAVKIDVLKNKYIAFAGTPNFMESITRVPGVDMIARGQGVSKPVIRGLSMNDILVLKNGVRVENYQFSENHPLGVDDNDIDRVEVIKGPASLLYGSDAIGGVLNFIKKEPAPIGKITGDYQVQMHSNTLGLNNSLGIEASSQHFFSGLRISNKTHADYIQGGGDFVPNSRFNEWSVSSDAGYTGQKGTFKIFYDYFKQDLGMTVPDAIPLITRRDRKNDIWYQDLEHHMISSQNKLFFGRFKWETNVAYQCALRRLRTTKSYPTVEMNLSTLTYESKLYLPSDENSEYIIGIQGMSQANRNRNNRESQFLPDADVNNIGALALIQYTIYKKLRIQGGIRFDLFKTETYALGTPGTENFHEPVSKDLSSINGSFGATYTVNEKLMFRGNFAKAYRVPNISELTSNGEHANRYEIGNPNLKSENAYEADFSIHYHGEYLSFDMATFCNYIRDYIFCSPTADTTVSGMIIYRFSQTDSKLYGGEAGLHIHPKTISWLHTEIIYSTVTGIQKNNQHLPFIPANKFHYEIRAEKEKIGFIQHPNISLTALTALKQKRPSPFETITGGYTIVNTSIGFEVKISSQLIDIRISVNNIFDSKYFDHLSTLKSLGYFNQGRNICLMLKVPFAIK